MKSIISKVTLALALSITVFGSTSFAECYGQIHETQQYIGNGNFLITQTLQYVCNGDYQHPINMTSVSFIEQ